jgi:hypothetical protein
MQNEDADHCSILFWDMAFICVCYVGGCCVHRLDNLTICNLPFSPPVHDYCRSLNRIFYDQRMNGMTSSVICTHGTRRHYGLSLFFWHYYCVECVCRNVGLSFLIPTLTRVSLSKRGEPKSGMARVSPQAGSPVVLMEHHITRSPYWFRSFFSEGTISLASLFQPKKKIETWAA